ncbi:hypothetical protein HPB47_000841 [Ixodes persulcatus]|uniref:Uncharacterized protein n=1 Tax=Ixodes persulcatus TaxID=34615 RepID=A0AC60PQT9_IXOPE|nr:hypothetical protein HPB47_000841 [Ixodes persulcatus]
MRTEKTVFGIQYQAHGTRPKPGLVCHGARAPPYLPYRKTGLWSRAVGEMRNPCLVQDREDPKKARSRRPTTMHLVQSDPPTIITSPSARLGYCATEAQGWARGGASASAAAMTTLLWNAETGEARAVAAEPAAAAAPARQLCAVYVPASRDCAARSTAHYASHAKLLNVGQCSSCYKISLCLIEAQLKRDSVQVRPPPPVIRIPPPPPPPKTRINIEGGGLPKHHEFKGRIEQDLFRIRGGGVVHGYGEGTHIRNPQVGTIRQGEVGIGVRIPIGRG